MRRTLTTIALLSAAAFCAHADDSRLMTSVTQADLQTLVTEEGHTVMSTGDDGAYSVRARTADGLIFNLVGAACDTEFADGCLGISMQVRYDADGEETLERINEVNLMWAATTAWFSAVGFDGNTPTVGITRYVILDRGATAGNIKDNLLNLLTIAPQAADYIWQAGEYAPGYEYDEDYWYGDW
ncbi:MAG: YbjN domain-containing protein [Hyphomonas sp.]